MAEKNTAVSLDDLMPLITEQLSLGQSVKFSPRGVSMLPMLRQGVDSVVLSPLPQQLKKYDIPLYKRENGSYVLHRVIKVGEHYTLMGDNQFVKEEGISHSQLIGVVTAFYRGDKKYSTDNVLYRGYCVLWCAVRPARHFAKRCIRRIGRCFK